MFKNILALSFICMFAKLMNSTQFVFNSDLEVDN